MALETGKFFDMHGYDALAFMQDTADDHVRYYVLGNNTTHIHLEGRPDSAYASTVPSPF